MIYIDVLDDILLNYNNTVHSSIRHTPVDVFSGKEYPMVQGLNLKKTDKRKFKIRDSVRAIKVRKTFDKRGFVPTFSMTVSKITDIKNNKYELSNGKSYYEEEERRKKKQNFEIQTPGFAKKKNQKKVCSTRDSNVVTHHSTNLAHRCLTSEFRWDRVLSPGYDRRHLNTLVGSTFYGSKSRGKNQK